MTAGKHQNISVPIASIDAIRSLLAQVPYRITVTSVVVRGVELAIAELRDIHDLPADGDPAP